MGLCLYARCVCVPCDYNERTSCKTVFSVFGWRSMAVCVERAVCVRVCGIECEGAVCICLFDDNLDAAHVIRSFFLCLFCAQIQSRGRDEFVRIYRQAH